MYTYIYIHTYIYIYTHDHIYVKFMVDRSVPIVGWGYKPSCHLGAWEALPVANIKEISQFRMDHVGSYLLLGSWLNPI
jgi:hypothetical protein